ncbi:MAG: type IV pilin protein [bacterium]
MKRFIKSKNKKGFTLIELMVTMAIVGILSMIAIPKYLNLKTHVKITEAKANIGAIRSCEELYNNEFDMYVACAANPTSNASILNKRKQSWNYNQTDFTILGFFPQGDVYYGYGVICISLSAYRVEAYGDVDDDDALVIYSLNQDGGEVRASTTTTY